MFSFDNEVYFEENEFYPVDGLLSAGDHERLRHIAKMNNLPSSKDSSVISFLIRDYYEKHNVKEFIKSTTGIEYKEYEEFLNKIRNSNNSHF